MTSAGDEQFGMAFDEQGCLTSETPCIKCSYNLRTIHRDAACPECGTAVGRTIYGNRLRYCDPKWLKQVWEGLNLFGLALFALVVLVIVIAQENLNTPAIYLAAPIATAFVLLIYGFIKASKPDPVRIDWERWLSARRVARWLLLLAPVLVIVGAVGEQAIWETQDYPNMWSDFFVLLPPLGVGAAPVSLLLHAAGLAGRLPNRALRAAVLAVDGCLALFVLLTAIVAADGFWLWLDMRTGGHGEDWRWWFEDLMPGVAISTVALLVALLVWYWWALSRAAKFAWTTWAKRNND